MIERFPFISVAVLALTALGIISSSTAATAGGNGDPGPEAVSILGVAQVRGQDVIVDVLVAVQPGEKARDAALAALQRQGARPLDSAGLGSQGFTLTGLKWDSLPAVQNYNPSNEPSSLNGAGQNALTSTHATWDAVATSLFDIDLGEITDRCPSLVKECPGPQFFDGSNDVAWLRLGGRTLGVTWYGTSTDEADMALNTRFNWNDGCANVSGSYDAQTVFLHENGHVVGLGHSNDASAIMFASYQGARCTLGQDDEEGATYLYPTQTATVSGTVTDTGGDPMSGATVSLQGTPFSADTDATGNYAITGVPYPVTYDITASAADHKSSTVRQRVDEDPETVSFQLEPAGGGHNGGGGPPPCKGKNKNDPGC